MCGWNKTQIRGVKLGELSDSPIKLIIRLLSWMLDDGLLHRRSCHL
ncbi:hypothetical protein VCRA2123O444_50022 [Vibrio crassostreae]|nr:hypothetical protein VCRA2114O422_50022 [Vibrio crassostreae]CAK2153066.1 hypothetical protein VCRA2119O431_50130 [Vibrio crassostreae]CAK2161736.1 hypothetical protein VCRA2119O430_60022 [Vibrio crassostreae]CAK2166252.1 hypothetical protein VCRA2113O409_70022 [Vibrio crassostreae]CAK2168315.1 hypothetical protein VCRA2113O412_70022 [Vibrio crassostreae]